ncbi:ABC transporter ATP-binding protein [Sphingobacterium alkalisoli]|uniref:ABC transporter ATP-binding protein n=1 Tax=Sphingobacterium alkalisoli TaxID=1874115 RepID=A0A4V5LXV2_9SPHI|nr:ABC transporter ATP-binding protein [Sphingobacterium alkalisoli]TJY63699.1 ABC transporter ATP-binding protein [Sphingobacterium alkalisoli]GGH25472.1 multidrug ABC transporter ATP-binding protein [Sphingobacterium alkalisoli]
MDNTIVKISHLWHRYGTAWAIQDIDFEINEFGVLGLLGSNGAGKSTTMNIMCGVLNQVKGNVTIGGFDMRENSIEAKKLIGFLPQNAPLYLDLTVNEYLTQCAHLRLIPRKEVEKAVDRAMAKCGVAHFRNRLISNLSGGYKQRVGIAQAIIHEPKLVVLDEPTNGLDPNQILEVRKLIKEIGEEKAVIFSSHILSEVQATCEQVKMIENGLMVFEDSMDAFNNYIEPDSLLMRMENPPLPEVLEVIPNITGVEVLSAKQFRVRFSPSTFVSEQLIEASVSAGWRLQELTLEKSSLDQIFAQLSNKTPNKK